MTKRKTSLTKVIASTNNVLTIPKEKFRQMVMERIDVGEGLMARKIENKSQLNLALKEYEIWNNQTSVLLKQSFDDPDNEYRTSYDFVNIKGTFFSGSSIEEEAEYLQNDLRNKLTFLHQLIEKLPQIKYEEQKQSHQQIIKDEINSKFKSAEQRKFHLQTITDETDPYNKIEEPKETHQETKKAELKSEDKVEEPQEIHQPSVKVPVSSGNKIFVAVDPNNEARLKVTKTLEKLELEPIILPDKANERNAVFEIIESNPDAAFAVFILTDDNGKGQKHRDADNNSRAKENLIFELGYIAGRIGIDRVCILYNNGAELPVHIQDIASIPLDSADHWQIVLAKKLKAAGYKIDVNNII
jgi:predicted nucleotide-binding protein